MQLHVYCRFERPLTLPVNYNHIVQSMIYSSLGNAAYKSYLHEEGSSYEKRKFKLFTFSRIFGKSSFSSADKKITFYEDISFEVRSPDPFLIRALREGIENRGLVFGERVMRPAELTCGDITVEAAPILVEMKSPICVYSTDPDTKKTYYATPDDELFPQLIFDNFYRKYTACYGVSPGKEFVIMPYEVTPEDKVVTTFKGQYIIAYGGKYVLAGSRKYLDFLYQTGIGSKNSQGFGLFTILGQM